MLQFGLKSAPQIFTKCLAPVAANLRSRGIQVFPYLDDWLLKAPSKQSQGCHNSLYPALQYARTHFEQGQIELDANPKHLIPRSISGHRPVQSIHVSRSTGAPSKISNNNFKKVSFCSNIQIAPRDVLFSNQLSPFSTAQNETSSRRVTETMATSIGIFRRCYPNNFKYGGRTPLVVPNIKSCPRSHLSAEHPRIRADNRRLHGRMGRSFAGFTNPRKVVSETEAHQLLKSFGTYF